MGAHFPVCPLFLITRSSLTDEVTCQDDAATNSTDGPAADVPGERIIKFTHSKTFVKSQKKLGQAQRLVFDWYLFLVASCRPHCISRRHHRSSCRPHRNVPQFYWPAGYKREHGNRPEWICLRNDCCPQCWKSLACSNFKDGGSLFSHFHWIFLLLLHCFHLSNLTSHFHRWLWAALNQRILWICLTSSFQWRLLIVWVILNLFSWML